MDALEQRLMDLEYRYMEQEQVIEQLNEVITEQQKRLMLLEKHHRQVLELLKAGRTSDIASLKDEVPPPHY
jgi:SlyX protein|tara:strand:+ start:1471 stop:1683 length:213 start_codon:yes stop_codon:yes gene_type:complete